MSDMPTDLPPEVETPQDFGEGDFANTQGEVGEALDWEEPADVTEQQEQQAIEELSEIPEIQPEVWSELDESERLEAAQDVENTMAEIQGRPSVEVQLDESLEPGTYGYYDGQSIHISEWCLSDDHPKETVDTIVHEGRHAYQDYAVQNPGFHQDEAEVAAWEDNFQNYLTAQEYGQEVYQSQPVEADAWDYGSTVADGIYGE